MMNDIQQLLAKLKNNLPLFAEMFLKIVSAEGQLVPLKFNNSQLYLHNFIENQLAETGMVRVVVPKGRKQGVSTYTEARLLHKTIFNSYKSAFILSHHSSTTKVLFDMVRLFYNNLPDQFKHKLLVDNSRELQFVNSSRYSIATAGEGEVGRGSTPHYLHVSEMASFDNTEAIQTGILEAVALAQGTEIIIESTAKGVGNMFHQYTISALEKRGVYRVCFLPWYLHEDNTFPAPKYFRLEGDEAALQKQWGLSDDQIYWRRLKKEALHSEWMFKQEFPATIAEAFQTSGTSFFDAECIYKAQKAKVDASSKSLVIGVDPARKGDRTVIVFRRGRCVEDILTYTNMDEMKLAGILSKFINDKKPQKVFIDTGMGYGTIDRLNELGFGRIVQGVNFGEGAMDPELFKNKRAEMAHTMRDWLEKNEVQLPENDDMVLDLLAIPEAITDSSGRILLESKDKIKKSYGKSPDIFDAMILTFAYPIRENVENSENLRYNTGAKKKPGYWNSPVMRSFDKRKSKFLQ